MPAKDSSSALVSKVDLRQWKIICSGCQCWNQRVIAGDTDGSSFAFCSTLAIYVFNSKSFQLSKLIAGSFEQNINALTWNPHDSNQVLTSSTDGLVIVWDLDREEPLYHYRLKQKTRAIEWSPLDPHEIFIVDYYSTVQKWTAGSEMNALEVMIPSSKSSEILLFHCHPNLRNVFAISFKDGSIHIHRTEASKQKPDVLVPPEKKSITVDLQWDTLSSVYLLVGYSTTSTQNIVILWDTENTTELSRFTSLHPSSSGTLRSVAWIPWNPGNFATVTRNSGQIRIWNVSQNTSVPIDTITVSTKGFHDFMILQKRQRAICAFVDGSVGIYHMGRRQLEWISTSGHTETIFDVRFQPSDYRTFATCSYDSTTRIWREGQVKSTLRGQDGIIYSIAWHPGDDNVMATASSLGTVCLWNIGESKISYKVSYATEKVYVLSWNTLNQDLIAFGSSDGGLYVISQRTGSLLVKVEHEFQIYGVAWSPFNENTIAIGTQDKSVLIYKVNTTSSGGGSATLIRKLDGGHTLKVFHVVWSVLVPNLLASGSDDKTIRVYNEDDDDVIVLKGHSHRVRAIVWSPEIPCILVSGSWDKTIRVWNVVSSSCLKVVTDHMADIYGIAVHPARPFDFVSSSRDTSIRMWHMTGGSVSTLLIKSVINEARLDSVLGNTNKLERIVSDCKLYGSESKRLASVRYEKLQRYQQLFEFFGCGTAGIDNLWVLIKRQAGDTDGLWSIGEGRDVIHHEEDVVTQGQRDAMKFDWEENDSSGRRRRSSVGVFQPVIPGMKKEEQLYEAASYHLKCGNFKRYVLIMKSLGKWERALAIAPAVSIAFWKELCVEYGKKFAQEESVEALPFFLAAGEVGEAIDLLQDRNDLQSCVLLSKVEMEGGFKTYRVIDDNIGVSEENDLKGIRHQMATAYSTIGETILAACCHLSIDESSLAVKKLLGGNLVELAYAVALNTCCSSSQEAMLATMLKKCEKVGDWKLAVEITELMRNPRREAALLCSKFKDEKLIREEADLRSAESFEKSANEHRQRNDLKESALCYVMANKHVDAADFALRVLCKSFSEDGDWDLNTALEFFKSVVVHIDLTVVDSSTRDEILAFSAFLGAQRAMAKKYPPHLVSYLLYTVKVLCRNTSFVFPISLEFLSYQEALYKSQEKTERDEEFEEMNNALTIDGSFEDSDSSTVIYIPGCNLPSGGARRNPICSRITGKFIQGPVFYLSDNASAISLQDAIMLSSVNPFDLLNTGEKINPC